MLGTQMLANVSKTSSQIPLSRGEWSPGTHAQVQPITQVKAVIGHAKLHPAAAAEVQKQLLSASPASFTNEVGDDVAQMFKQNAERQVRRREGLSAEPSSTGTASHGDHLP